MPAITITVLGEEAVQRAIDKRSAPRLTASSQKGLHLAGAAAKPFIAAAAPVASGATRDSVRQSESFGRVTIGPHTPWAGYVIRGTNRGVEPNPWVSRGARTARPASAIAFRQSVRQDIR